MSVMVVSLENSISCSWCAEKLMPAWEDVHGRDVSGLVQYSRLVRSRKVSIHGCTFKENCWSDVSDAAAFGKWALEGGCIRQMRLGRCTHRLLALGQTHLPVDSSPVMSSI